ncbi:MAG: HAMP domain-containing histidine kinase [Clostridia bacterium]|nr:HAMP domain-containing histidine kinase [Clostridia bacterium]
MKNNRLSLNAKLMMVQLGALCLALAVFLLGMMVGRWILNTYYLSEEACFQRELDYVRSLNSYVQTKGLASGDTEALEQWARDRKYVYLALYAGETPILETDGYETSGVSSDASQIAAYTSNLLPVENHEEITQLSPDEDGYYRLQFADGIFRVSIVEFSETPYYDLVVILALAFACMTLLSVTVAYNRSVTRAIIRLSKEVQWVEQGSRDSQIRSMRDDEIGDLARAVERMRRAIIQRMQSEQDAWSANSGLITAISHDIRTPLTALMGYLDLLEGKQYQNEEQMARYLHASRDKARQLKELTDELFRYFLVFATPQVKMQKERYDAIILMEQMLGEKIVRLMEAGFTVQSIPLEKPCTVEVDVQHFHRVLDNLFSNIEKHADREKRVTVMARVEDGQMMIDLVNGVPDRPNRVESTKIGLQTCRKIVQDMGGVFETQMEDGKFLAEIALPCVKEEKL